MKQTISFHVLQINWGKKWGKASKENLVLFQQQSDSEKKNANTAAHITSIGANLGENLAVSLLCLESLFLPPGMGNMPKDYNRLMKNDKPSQIPHHAICQARLKQPHSEGSKKINKCSHGDNETCEK